MWMYLYVYADADAGEINVVLRMCCAVLCSRHLETVASELGLLHMSDLTF